MAATLEDIVTESEREDDVILDAKLGLYQFHANTCSSREMTVYPLVEAWEASTTRWSNRPAILTGTGTHSSVSTQRGASACANGWTIVDLTRVVAGWADSEFENHGMHLRAGDAANTSFERQVCSMNPDSSDSVCKFSSRTPYRQVTYQPDEVQVAPADCEVDAVDESLDEWICVDGEAIEAESIPKDTDPANSDQPIDPPVDAEVQNETGFIQPMAGGSFEATWCETKIKQ